MADVRCAVCKARPGDPHADWCDVGDDPLLWPMPPTSTASTEAYGWAEPDNGRRSMEMLGLLIVVCDASIVWLWVGVAIGWWWFG